MTLAHPRPSLLAKCDPAGGSIRYGFLAGRAPVRQRPDGGSEEVGLTGLAVADRQDALAEAFEDLRPDNKGNTTPSRTTVITYCGPLTTGAKSAAARLRYGGELTPP